MILTESIHSIIKEYSSLIKYLSNTDIYSIINNSKIENIPYVYYLSFIFLCISLLYLLDGVYTHWKNTFRKSNKYDTKKYNNIIFLLLHESLKYISQMPNLITLFIGIIQSVYVNKSVNIIVTIACWSFSVSNEFIKFYNSQKTDEIINNNQIIKNNTKIRADKLNLEDNIILNYNDISPSFVKITDIKCNNNNFSEEERKDHNVGFYCDKDSTGEDISKSFTIGDTIPPHRNITRPNIEISGKITKYVEPISYKQFNHQVTTPIFLNNVRFFIDLYAIFMLLFISLCVTASANINNYDLIMIFKHFFAAMIAGNILIPSMRMTLLYNVYNLIMSLSFSSVKINSYDSFIKLEDIKSVIFDKTGTITEEHLEVHQHYANENNTVLKKLEFLEWNQDEIIFALTIANSESNIVEIISNKQEQYKFWGTSPEENKILEYWFETKKVTLLFNPVKSPGILRFKFPNLPERQLVIKNRYSYNFETGKIAIINLKNPQSGHDINLIIRQHGTSRFLDNMKINRQSSSDFLHSLCSGVNLDEPCDLSLDWANKITKDDKRRSMAIAIAINECDTSNNTDNNIASNWDIVSIYTFENPLREKMCDVIDFFKSMHIPCSILTGDGQETSEDIAKKAGFPENLFNIKTEENIKSCLELAKNHKISVSIEAAILKDILNNTENLAELFLNNKNIFKIIYKASKNIKEQVVLNTNKCLYVGDAKNDELAIQKAYVGVCLSHGAELCRLYSSINIKHPQDLIDILNHNGYKDMLLIGGQKILKDVCFLGGLVCGCLVVGIHLHQFEFLNQSLLYKDVWDPLPMLMISSILYTSSVVGYASSNCIDSNKNKDSDILLTLYSVLNNITGFIIGTFIAWFIKNYLLFLHFDSIILHVITTIILLKHSIHCLGTERMFGTQLISNNNKIIGFAMNIMDSIPFRMLLYFLFSFIF
jgi:soluble P-type ATPase